MDLQPTGSFTWQPPNTLCTRIAEAQRASLPITPSAARGAHRTTALSTTDPSTPKPEGLHSSIHPSAARIATIRENNRLLSYYSNKLLILPHAI